MRAKDEKTSKKIRKKKKLEIKVQKTKMK